MELVTYGYHTLILIHKRGIKGQISFSCIDFDGVKCGMIQYCLFDISINTDFLIILLVSYTIVEIFNTPFLFFNIYPLLYNLLKTDCSPKGRFYDPNIRIPENNGCGW